MMIITGAGTTESLGLSESYQCLNECLLVLIRIMMY